MSNAEFASPFDPPFKCHRFNPACDRKVMSGGAKVLPDSDNITSHSRQISQRALDLGIGLPHSDDDARLGH